MRTINGTIALIIALFLVGCSAGSNPAGPSDQQPEPEPEIIIRSQSLLSSLQSASEVSPEIVQMETLGISISSFPTTANPISVSRCNVTVPFQRLFLTRETMRTTTPLTCSRNRHRHLTEGCHSRSYGSTYRVYLVDDDFGGDVTMARVTVRPSNLYSNDNAPGLDRTITGSNGFRARIRGSWVY